MEELEMMVAGVIAAAAALGSWYYADMRRADKIHGLCHPKKGEKMRPPEELSMAIGLQSYEAKQRYKRIYAREH